MSSANQKKHRSKSERNASSTDLPDVKTNADTSKTSVHRQGKIDGRISDN